MNVLIDSWLHTLDFMDRLNRGEITLDVEEMLARYELELAQWVESEANDE